MICIIMVVCFLFIVKEQVREVHGKHVRARWTAGFIKQMGVKTNKLYI